jgi:poly(3-hydroxybutyrate) depolymerase
MPVSGPIPTRADRSHPRRQVGAVVALIGAGALVGSLLAPSASGAPTSVTAADAVAGTTAGCGKAPTLTNGTHTITSGGQSRSYILDIPSNYDRNHPYRLIFGLHWYNGSAAEVAGGNWGFYGQKAASNGSAILVAPQGLDAGWANTNGRDLTLIDDLIKLIENDLCIDTSQLFSMGFSYGGAMTFALACARPTVFRGVVVFSGGNLSGCNGGTQPVAYFGVHGIRDGVLNISNGRSLRDQFVRNNGCTPQNPPEPAQGSLRHIVTAYSGCKPGYPVWWAAFDGDHTASPVDGENGYDGARTWTGAEAWKFISQLESTTTPPTTTPPTTTPPTTPTPTTPTPTTPTPTTPPAATCSVTAAVNAWNNGLTENLTITNRGSSPINGWKLTFALPTGQTITAGWNASYSPSSGTVTATNAGHNGTLAPGTSTTIGFQATHTGNSDAASSFSLNDTACS